jgi:hypothetical protein
MEEWREAIRETGIGVTDGSPRNTKGQNPNQNNIQQYDISFRENIQMNLVLARDLEEKAFAMIGITRERQGNPNEYSNAEGIKQGMEASYAQTEVIYKRFNAAKVKEKEIELAIAQYATANKKDISVNYINGQNERVIQNFVDENFAFRKLEVFAADDSSKRRELEQFKQHILSLNTMDNDIYDLAKVVTSDNFVSLVEFGKQKKEKLEQQTKEQREHENNLAQQQSETLLQVEKEKMANTNNEKRLDRESAEYQTEVKARETIADSNASTDVVGQLHNQQKLEQSERDNQIKSEQRQQEINMKRDKQNNDVKNDMSKVDEMFLKMRENAKDRRAMLEKSKNTVDVARINPG